MGINCFSNSAKCKEPSTIFLAPMAGYTDSAFCHIATENGADGTFSEMISMEALYRDNEKTLKMIRPASNAKIFGLQLFGGDHTKVEKSINLVMKFFPSIIDLNCGCPVLKIIKSGAGSSLLQRPSEIYKILSRMKEVIDSYNLDCRPKLSVKIRLGYDHSHINFLEVADVALEAGVDMITLHGRTKSDLYSGKANWEAITLLKEHIVKVAPQVRVFGSGDLFTALDGYKMLAETKVDGIMYARGAVGNPWIFNQTKRLLEKFPISENKIEQTKLSDLEEYLNSLKPTYSQVVSTLLEHINLATNLHGKRVALNEMKKHIGSYLKAFNNVKELRKELLLCQDMGELVQHLLTLNNHQ